MSIVPSIDRFSSAELLQLMHFYAEAGVDWLLEDEPQDRYAEFSALETARARPAAASPVGADASRGEASGRDASRMPASAVAPRTIVAVPDAEAVTMAIQVAAAAGSIEALAAAVSDFSGCNLRNSARNTVFFSGNPQARIAVAAGMPSADDDRDGAPFSGPAGAMLEKMLGAIGIAREEVLVFNLIPWRPAGSRPPTRHEIDICRPFGMRLLELLQPQAILSLGNFAAKFLCGAGEGIHGVRGRQMAVSVGDASIPMMATFHPQDMMAAPACKRLAWLDLLAFRASLTF